MRIPSLRWRFWSIGFVVVVLLLTASIVAYAQFDYTGAVGRIDDEDSSPLPARHPSLSLVTKIPNNIPARLAVWMSVCPILSVIRVLPYQA